MNHYRVKRSCLHNLRITRSTPFPDDGIAEGLVLPREMMRLADIAPYEQVNLTKIGGDRWVNRMYTFVLPGDDDTVEARGSIAHLLGEGELCCLITTTSLDAEQYERHLNGRAGPGLIDVRLYPASPVVNDLSCARLMLEHEGRLDRIDHPDAAVLGPREALPRTYLSNLLSGLQVASVEKGGCIEMSAELPVEYMEKAGFCMSQSILVYNASRGGASAESYVVPSLQHKTVGISGALAALADLGDVISEAAFVCSTAPSFEPVLYRVPADAMAA
ncbi:hypothetical protein [Eleftheria terrae]|uniref:hypothetical protein n=1 Tax=Eleftheria terrae TaxID=1597781 RepID=UPI00263BAD57|nr:hypothetical protein [Eleftheria terrae]WKB51688.1 hypothetical protein N7L95_18065 [Eleftheria terrae]